RDSRSSQMPTTIPQEAASAARILALMIAVDGRIERSQLDALERLGAFERIGTSRERFLTLARGCLDDIGASLCEKSWLSPTDTVYLDPLLAMVQDPDPRLWLCRLAAAVHMASPACGHARMVHERALARWHVQLSEIAAADA